MIGNDIVITVTDIRGDKIRLGVEAPKEVPVHRSEIYEAIKRQEQEAVNQEKENTDAESI